eukprot:1323178-Pyramimonas_sp.AAC.1
MLGSVWGGGPASPSRLRALISPPSVLLVTYFYRRERGRESPGSGRCPACRAPVPSTHDRMTTVTSLFPFTAISPLSGLIEDAPPCAEADVHPLPSP